MTIYFNGKGVVKKLKIGPFTIDNFSWEFLILSSLYLFVFSPIYKRRESKRIQDANNEIIKMNIFFIINDNLITKELLQKYMMAYWPNTICILLRYIQ